MPPEPAHLFDRCGVAALSELHSPECRARFAHLERQQQEFLSHAAEFRSPEYKWPRDPLHTWSRVWEYPYVHHHVEESCSRSSASGPPRVVDLGSGVTFFPFSVAQLGCHVTCADIDPVCAKDLARAAQVIDCRPGRVDFRLIAD